MLVLIVIGLFAWHPWNRGSADNSQQARQAGGRRGGGPGMGAQPQPVHVATVTQGEMPVVINALGTVTPLTPVKVKTQINGSSGSRVQEGQMVKQGDLLAAGRSAALRVALRSAQGTLQKDEALLKTARTRPERYKKLLVARFDRQPAGTTRRSSLVQPATKGTGKVGSGARRHRSSSTSPTPRSWRRCRAASACAQVDQGNYCRRPATRTVLSSSSQVQPISGDLHHARRQSLTAVRSALAGRRHSFGEGLRPGQTERARKSA